MNIPKTVKIGGITYDVKVLPEFPPDDKSDGHLRFSEQEIIVLRDDKHKQEYVEAVFIHELIHGITTHAQFKFPKGEEERYIECVSLGLYALIKDNPELFK